MEAEVSRIAANSYFQFQSLSQTNPREGSIYQTIDVHPTEGNDSSFVSNSKTSKFLELHNIRDSKDINKQTNGI